MLRSRFACLGTFLAMATVTLAIVACGGEPPEKEMQQAQGAIDAARAAGADQYAKDEFGAAVSALERARRAANDRDYRQALNDALDSRERAQNAAREAADNMAAARVDADRAVAAAAATHAALSKRLAELEAAKIPARSLAEPRKALMATEKHVQEARAAFERGEYPAATTAAAALSQERNTIRHALDAAATPGRRSR
jgi:trimeric autotransporter adhesin